MMAAIVRLPSPSVPAARTLLAAVVLLSLVGVVPARPASAQADDGPNDPARELAERYAPLVAVRPTTTVCGEGEPFAPAPVESVLGRDDVTLRGPDGQVVTAAPTAADLFSRGEGYHLDLPGNPLDPGCTYARWWADMAADHPPTIYARVTEDPDQADTVVVQYWFWWVFNDWNDKHEGDWEMVQVVFDAASPEQALTVAPRLVVFAQHEGAHYVEWDDDTDLVRDGDRVVTHPGAGSHADYPSANLWFGKSASTGFGCDDSRAPTTRLDPQVVLLPSSTDEVSGPDDPFAWLTFTGRWGQQAPSFNNGPQGPATKHAWEAPTGWVEDVGRPSAVAIPPLGSTVSDFFCTASREGSLLFVKALDEPVIVALGALVLVAAVVTGVSRTRWRPSASTPVAVERRAGQLLTAAARLLGENARPFGALALVVLGGGAVAVVVQDLVLDHTLLGHLSDTADETTAWAVPVALLAGALVTVPVAAFTRAAAAVVVQDLAAGRRPSFRAASRGALRPPNGTLTAVVVHVIASVGFGPTVLLPVSVWLVARWGIAAPVAVAEGLTVRQALARSRDLTKGHRWRTAGVTFVANGVVAVLGPLVGTVVLVATDTGFGLVNLLSALVGMVVIPWAAVVVALLHQDLRCRTGEGAPPALDEPVAVR
jgi:hypothetical protein